MTPAYGGTPKILKSLASGESENLIFLNDIKLRNLERTWESLFWLLPIKEIY